MLVFYRVKALLRYHREGWKKTYTYQAKNVSVKA